MRKKIIAKANAGHNVLSIVIGIAISLIVTFLLTMGTAKLILEGYIGLNEAGYLSALVWAISIGIGVIFAGSFRKADFIRNSALIAGTYWAVMTARSIITLDISMASCVVCLLIIFAVLLCANLLNQNKKGSHRGKGKRAYR